MAAGMRAGIVVQAADSPQLQELAQALQGHAVTAAQLTLDDGRSFPLPDVLVQVLQHLVTHLAAGHDAIVTPVARDYTPLEAAYFLGASRYYVDTLVETGELPSTLVGTQRWIAFPDLVAHRAKLRERMAEGVRLIQQLSEEEGAYDG